MHIERFLSPIGGSNRKRGRRIGPALALTRTLAAVLAAVLAVAVLAVAGLLPAANVAFAQEEPAAADAAVWYVNGSTGSDGNCNTAGAPCRTIQAAIDRAASGDTVLVAAGTYTFAGANSCTGQTGAPAVICVFAKKVVMRGGFAPGNFNNYNPAQNPTILDGQSQNRGIFVLSFNNAGATALDIAGFTVRNGLGTGIGKRPGEDAYFGFGGGMFVEYAGAILLQDMRFENNRAVGSDRGSGAGGTGAGGGISFRSTTAAHLENVVFTGNQAIGGSGGDRGGGGQGGGLWTNGSSLTANNLTFTDNLAQAGNSGGSGFGSNNERADAFGGAATFEEGSTIRMNNVIARGNRALGGNAGVNAGGAFGGAFMGEVADITITGAEISNNLARGGNAQSGWIASGGALSTIHSTVNLNQVVITNNTAQGGNGSNGDWGLPNGGGITVSWVSDRYNSSLTVANSIIAGNRAVTGQGREISIGGGGGLWIQATNALLDHTTIADNQLVGGGLFGAGIQVLQTGSRGANVTIRNSLLTGHQNNAGSAVDVLTPSTVNFDDGLFYNNTYNTSNDNPIIGGNRGTVNGLGSMGSANPQYVSPGAPAYDYHLKAGSPARNKVTNVSRTRDVDNEPRDDGSPDFGADEYSAPARPPIVYAGVSSTRTTITIHWDLAPELAGQLSRYVVTYSYRPRGGGSPVSDSIDVGKQTSYTLRDLEPLVVYTVTIDALNGSNQVIASGGQTTQITSNTKAFLSRITR